MNALTKGARSNPLATLPFFALRGVCAGIFRMRGRVFQFSAVRGCFQWWGVILNFVNIEMNSKHILVLYFHINV